MYCSTVSSIHSNRTLPSTLIDLYGNLQNSQTTSIATTTTTTTTNSMLELESPHLRPALLLSRWQREAAPEESDSNSIPEYCDRFRVPNEKNNTFFSPLDPLSMTNTYPKESDCTHVLEGKSISTYIFRVRYCISYCAYFIYDCQATRQPGAGHEK